MVGLIDTGLGMQRRSLSGMIKHSGEELEIYERNKEMRAAEKAAGMGMMGKLTGKPKR